MASRTLYDILEVSETASPEAIRAAWERLSPKWDPERAGNQTTMEARLQYNAIKDAYFTLANANRRQAYDHRLNAEWRAPVEKPSNAVGKIALVLLVVLGISIYYHDSVKQEQARLEAEKVIAAAKAKEAEEKARIELEVATLLRQREDQAREDRLRRQREVDLSNYQKGR